MKTALTSVTIFFVVLFGLWPIMTAAQSTHNTPLPDMKTVQGVLPDPPHTSGDTSPGNDSATVTGAHSEFETSSSNAIPPPHIGGVFQDPSFQNDLGMTFIRIKPGSFLMGSSLSEMGAGENEELHPFNIVKPYYIQTTEVTQSQWEMVMGENPSYFQVLCGPECPVEKISWNDVQEFIRQMNEKFPHPAMIYRLPTEAEWEYAARAGTQKALYNGDLINPYNRDFKLDTIAWYWDNSGKRSHPVAQLQPNAWGLYDMLGNVWEWCQDWYDVRYLYGISDNVDEPSGNKLRVVRGGGWYSFAWRNRCASRDGADPNRRNGDVGFRLVAEPR